MRGMNKETIEAMKLKFWVEKKMGHQRLKEALMKERGTKPGSEMALIKLYCKTDWSNYDKYRSKGGLQIKIFNRRKKMENSRHKQGVELIHKLYAGKEALDEAYIRLDDTISRSYCFMEKGIADNAAYQDILSRNANSSFRLVEHVIKELNKAIKETGEQNE